MGKKLYPWNLLNAIREKDTENIRQNHTDDHAAGLDYAVSTLGDKEKEFIKLCYKEGKSYEEIEEILHCTTEQVLQLEKKCIKRLGEPELYHYIKYGISGYTQKILTEEYQKGFESGYEMGYEVAMGDVKNGLSRTKRDPSIMSLPLEVLQLDTRSYNCLYYYGCRTVGDCIKMEEDEIKRIRNLGSKSTDAIGRALQRKNIRHTDWDKFIIKEE